MTRRGNHSCYMLAKISASRVGMLREAVFRVSAVNNSWLRAGKLGKGAQCEQVCLVKSKIYRRGWRSPSSCKSSAGYYSLATYRCPPYSSNNSHFRLLTRPCVVMKDSKYPLGGVFRFKQRNDWGDDFKRRVNIPQIICKHMVMVVAQSGSLGWVKIATVPVIQ